MYEHHRQPVLPRPAFLRRWALHGAAAFAMVVGSLLIGMTGYRFLENLSWLDAFVNAAMLLGGMGPVTELHTAGGKLFAGCYALYSGLVFLVIVGVIFAPVLHRFFHHFYAGLDQHPSSWGSHRETDR